MLASVSWLKEYVDISVDTETLAHEITMLGLNVEHVVSTGVTDPNVVIGKVLEVEAHPNADRLRVCTVDVGSAAPLGIVCGAPNVEAGQTVLVALVGARLVDGTKIRKSKIRGEVSNGMICSEIELGLGADADGIIVLDGDYRPGAPASDALGEADAVLEIEVTPNRPDQLSHIGVAREIAALYGGPVRVPEANLSVGDKAGKLKIEIDDPRDCYRYVGRVVRDVKVGPSPAWLRARLEAVGLKSINNIVDVTNFVMMECGQPLHAFDLKRLPGQRIGVRRGRKGEEVVALNELTYEVDEDYLLITSEDEPVAVAGVIGGLETSVVDETSDLLIESAAFNQRTVRRTRNKMNLTTDASYRFERGSDREACLAASNRAAELIAEIAGGEVGEFVDAYPAPWEPRIVSIRRANTARLLGVHLSIEEIQQLLERLHFTPINPTADALDVDVPSYRDDIVEETDLVEEVARLYGYDRIGKGWQYRASTVARVDPFDAFVDSVAEHLVARGLTEVMTSSFMEGSEREVMGWTAGDRRHTMVPIRNPLSANHSYLRTSLLPGMLDAVKRNIDMGVRALRVFQIGKCYLGQSDEVGLPDEQRRLLLLLSEPAVTDFWNSLNKGTEFIDIKREIEVLLGSYRIDVDDDLDYTFAPVDGSFSYVHREAPVIEGGIVGNVAARHFGVDQPVWYADVDLDGLYALQGRGARFRELPEYPVSRRDLSLVTPPDVRYDQIEKSLVKSGGRLLESVQVFDVYKGDNLPEGRVAYGVRLLFRSPDRTLTDGEVDEVVDRIVGKLESELSVTLRK